MATRLRDELARSQRQIGRQGAMGAGGQRPHEVSPATLARLARELRRGTYRPEPLRELVIGTKKKKRRIGIPAAKDQIVLNLWRRWNGGWIERSLSDVAHAYRPGRNPDSAVARLMVRLEEGDHLVQVDVKDLFESIPHRRVWRAWRASAGRRSWLGRVGRMVGLPWRGGDLDREAMSAWLVRRWLTVWRPSGVGIPPGISIAPELSNLVLAQGVDPWLRELVSRKRARAVVRYADDMTWVSRGDPSATLAELERVLVAEGLRLNRKKTKRTPAAGPWPVEVLGVRVSRDRRGHLRRTRS